MQEFKQSKAPQVFTGDSLIIVTQLNQLFYNKDEQQFFLKTKDIQDLVDSKTDNFVYVGEFGNVPIFAIEAKNISKEGWGFYHAFSILDLFDDSTKHILFRAFQLTYWHTHSVYCGCCSTKTTMLENEFVKECGSCHQKWYPQYSPAIIVRITRDNEILLGRSYHFRKGMYSTLAGFIEAGETCEQAVIREVKEEVNIEVQNIKPVMIQPWPFPNSLMLGYTAQYQSGELKIDKNELEDARWFNIDSLPILPIKSSIARVLIDDFIVETSKKTNFKKSTNEFKEKLSNNPPKIATSPLKNHFLRANRRTMLAHGALELSARLFFNHNGKK